MAPTALRLLHLMLTLLKLTEWLTSLPALALLFWIWLQIQLPFNQALALWLVALAVLTTAPSQDEPLG
jgi:hypothetical protein